VFSDADMDANDHPVPHSPSPELHLQVQRCWTGRHIVVACSRFLPPGIGARRLDHLAETRGQLVPISKALQGDPHHYRFLVNTFILVMAGELWNITGALRSM
jgi:hypothetical protein